MKYILGKKIGMSQIFDSNEKVQPVTLIEAGPCFITQIKNIEKDKYSSAQIGFIKKTKKIKKSEKGKEFKHIKEFRLVESEKDTLNIGDEINVSIFKEGDKVKVSGVSKGKGYQGGVKRHGFHGRNATHGVKHEQRTIGSVGCGYPERVIKGRKMPGRMGADNVTVKNLTIVKVDKENNLLAVKGAVPGRNGVLLAVCEQK